MGKKKKSSNWFNLIFVAVLLIEAYMIFFWEPVGDKTRIHELYVYDALRSSPRLHPWMEFADDLDYWLVEREHAACSFRSGLYGRTPDILIHTQDITQEEWKGRLDWCLPHEVGHYIDDELGGVSQTEEFQQAAELSIIMWENLPEGEYHWRFTADMVSSFPGVNGNPRDENGWGGYRELYAELHMTDYLIQMPPPLRPYFDEFIPWIW